MNRLLKAAAALLCAVGLPLYASVMTATVTDTDLQPWNNCTYTATLVISGQPGVPVTSGGVAVTPAKVSGSCSATGVITVTLADTSTDDQAGSAWVFLIQSNTSAPPVTVTTTVIGSTPNLSPAFSQLAPPRFPAVADAFGYLDGEVISPLKGARYYNVTLQVVRQWNGTAWTGTGGSGTGIQLAPGQPVASLLSTPYNCYFFGDSNTAAIGVVSQADAMTQLLAQDTGCTPIITGLSGLFAEEIAGAMLQQFAVPPLASLNNAYRTPIVAIAVGTNNGFYCDPTGVAPACETNYAETLSFMHAWPSIPTASKVMASAATAVGTWTADAAVPLNAAVVGTTMKSTTNGDTLTFTVANSGPKIGITRISKDTNAGTFTVTIDGSAKTSICTGTTTFQAFGCSGTLLNQLGTNVKAPQREEFAVTPGVSHTVVVAVTSATSASNIVSILNVDTTPVSGTTVGPVVMQSGVFKSASDATTPVGLTAMNTVATTQTATSAADGFNVHFVDVRNPITFTNGAVSPAVNNLNDMETNNTTNCPTNGANGLHLNKCGEFHWTQSIEATALGQGVGFAYISQGAHAAYSASGFNSYQSVWNTSYVTGAQTQPFSTTAIMSGIRFFGSGSDGFLGYIGEEYDPTNSKYSVTTNFGVSTQVTWKTCASNYTATSQCTLRAFLDPSGNYTAKGYLSSALATSQTVGTAIASATTIAPTTGIAHVTGTVAIVTITPPAGYSATVGGCITLIADGAWTTTTAGNIFAAITAVAGTAYKTCYDGSKWFIN